MKDLKDQVLETLQDGWKAIRADLWEPDDAKKLELVAQSLVGIGRKVLTTTDPARQAEYKRSAKLLLEHVELLALRRSRRLEQEVQEQVEKAFLEVILPRVLTLLPAILDHMVTLRLAGELGLDEMAELCDEVVRLGCAGELVIELDLAEVTHLDFRGARPLAARRRFLTQAGGDLLLRQLSPYVAAILAASGQLEALGLAPADPLPESVLPPPLPGSALPCGPG